MRFSIRDLLWATVVVAMGLGWGLDNWRLRRERNEFASVAETNAESAIMIFNAYKELQSVVDQGGS